MQRVSTELGTLDDMGLETDLRDIDGIRLWSNLHRFTAPPEHRSRRNHALSDRHHAWGRISTGGHRSDSV